MGIERGGLILRSGWSVPPKLCDSCKLASATLFCHPDSMFLCILCDSKIHSLNKHGSRHERVWMCEVCEQAPAAVTCKADAAALCVTCDSDIHSANPLSQRHDRVPVEPFYDSAEFIVKASAANFGFVVPTDDGIASNKLNQDEPWLIPNPNYGSKLMDAPDIKSREMIFSDMDPFLDFDNSTNFFHNTGNDSVVPVQTKPAPVMIHHSSEACFDNDFSRSSFNYTSQSISQSVSSSDVGVVPDSSGKDREARVMRYREKRKNRKFEKTIRYASRKAYAETRPRIKGRFAKRTENDSEVDRLYNPSGVVTSVPATFMLDTQYGVVPSF
ncbi:hypothetical protein Lal_00006550 [Lupinus albus]|uniref:Putative transcription factor C2C2-CO-like family n=1 Tax=Lupinus albus TaxID=3870 RepID=A0A6A4Q884_LUPAL|nr:putative transcription factor C2C2-CO-like family [Lupinus albus]KAF1875919.1 hypothetical protein Lal_00006550 [Lupinus albus]